MHMFDFGRKSALLSAMLKAANLAPYGRIPGLMEAAMPSHEGAKECGF
jgi:hypothetical protein